LKFLLVIEVPHNLECAVMFLPNSTTHWENFTHLH